MLIQYCWFFPLLYYTVKFIVVFSTRSIHVWYIITCIYLKTQTKCREMSCYLLKSESTLASWRHFGHGFQSPKPAFKFSEGRGFHQAKKMHSLSKLFLITNFCLIFRWLKHLWNQQHLMPKVVQCYLGSIWFLTFNFAAKIQLWSCASVLNLRTIHTKYTFSRRWIK